MNEQARPSQHTLGDYAYDAIYIGGIGGGLVALFFLFYDIAARGEAFFTPSLMGKALFDGVRPAAFGAVDMMAVAKYTVVHLLAFGLLGLGTSFLTHQAEMRSKHPVLVMGIVFLALEIGFWLGSSFVIPGVIQRVGAGPIAGANLLAAAGIAVFLARTHSALWHRAGSKLPPMPTRSA